MGACFSKYSPLATVSFFYPSNTDDFIVIRFKFQANFQISIRIFEFENNHLKLAPVFAFYWIRSEHFSNCFFASLRNFIKRYLELDLADTQYRHFNGTPFQGLANIFYIQFLASIKYFVIFFKESSMWAWLLDSGRYPYLLVQQSYFESCRFSVLYFQKTLINLKKRVGVGLFSKS